MALGVGLGILTGISLDIARDTEVVEVAHAEAVEEPVEVQIEVYIDWTEERILKEIKNTFPDDYETAKKIALCESGYKMVQSYHVKDGVQEPSFGIFQVHEPSWDRVAKSMGLDYKNNIADNIKMARFIYDNAGQSWTDWSCLKLI